jgi:hypothetical protein
VFDFEKENRETTGQATARGSRSAAAEAGTTEEGSMMPKQKYSAKRIAALYSVSYETARRWIMKILEDDTAMGVRKNKGRGKRPYRLRRLDESDLPEIDRRFINH